MVYVMLLTREIEVLAFQLFMLVSPYLLIRSGGNHLIL